VNLPKPLGGPRRGWFIQLALLGMVELGALLYLAVGVRHAFDAVLSGGADAVGRMGLQWLVFGMALVFVSAVARGAQRPLGERFAQHYARRVRTRVLRRWMQQLARDGEGHGRGTLMVRLMGDAGALSRWHGRVMARSIANVTGLIAVTAALLVIAWPLAVAAMGPMLVGLLGQWWAGRRLEESTGKARQQRSKLGASVARVIDRSVPLDRFAVVDPVRQLNSRGRRLGAGMVEAARHSGWIEAFGLAMTGGSLVATLAVGTWLVAGNTISPGTVLLGGLWVSHFARPVHELARAQDAWRRARVSRQKLEGFLSGARKAGQAVDLSVARAQDLAARERSGA
jgi:ABC-type multidrug transport system fused ATPase/permease subunit